MRFPIVLTALLMASCYIEPTLPPSPEPYPDPDPVSTSDPHCGDGTCDEWNGEDEYNCVDCGLDPFTGCPASGGFCGDNVCCGYENVRNCWRDCSPKPYNPHVDPNDPGWIDPILEWKPGL
jgi:hypothetical protein